MLGKSGKVLNCAICCPGLPPLDENMGGLANKIFHLHPKINLKHVFIALNSRLFLGFLVSFIFSPWHQGMLVDQMTAQSQNFSQICNSS